MTSEERLKKYINDDEVYQDFINGKRERLSDFDMFCVEHCEDIRTILAQNEILRRKCNHYLHIIKETTEYLDSLGTQDGMIKDYMIDRNIKEELLLKLRGY